MMIFYEQERSKREQYLYHQNDINLTFPIHMHNSYELVVVLEGEIELTIEDEVYTLHENECTVILPRIAHAYKTKKYSKTYVCVFSIDYILDFYKITQNTIATSPIFKMQNAQKVVNAFQSPENSFALKSVLYYVISTFYASTAFEKIEKSNSYIYNVLEYVESHFLEDISLQTAADYLGYSYNYTSTLFNEIFKTSFNSFVNSCRISYAVQLLLNSKKSVSEIALLSGFDSLRAFNRNFKQIKHTTPTAYRKSMPDTI